VTDQQQTPERHLDVRLLDRVEHYITDLAGLYLTAKQAEMVNAWVERAAERFPNSPLAHGALQTGANVARRALAHWIYSPEHSTKSMARLIAVLQSVEASGGKLVEECADPALIVRARDFPFRTFKARKTLSSVTGRVRGIAGELASEIELVRQLLRDHYADGNPLAGLVEFVPSYPKPDLPDDEATDLLIALPNAIKEGPIRRQYLVRLYAQLSGQALQQEAIAAQGRLANLGRGGPGYIAHSVVGESAVLLHLLGRAQRTCKQLIVLARDDHRAQRARHKVVR
jgi:hypothetical protein